MTTTAVSPFGPIAAGIVTPEGDWPMPLSDLNEFRTAMSALGRDTDAAAWSAGYVTGFTAGLSGDLFLVDEVVRAKSVLWSATYDLPTALARIAMLGTAYHPGEKHNILRACGLLMGWKKGTADRPDADECVMCESRILTNVEGVTCDHGTFCDEDECQRAVCGGRCNMDPEFGL